MPFDPPVTITTLLRYLVAMVGVMKRRCFFNLQLLLEVRRSSLAAAFRASENTDSGLERWEKKGKKVRKLED